MFPSRFHLGGCRGIGVLVLLTAAALAQAQETTTRVARPDPLDAQTPVPQASHASALSNYRRLGDDARMGWKEANEAVNRIGGWRAYARETQQPESAPPAPAGGAGSGVAPGGR